MPQITLIHHKRPIICHAIMHRAYTIVRANIYQGRQYVILQRALIIHLHGDQQRFDYSIHILSRHCCVISYGIIIVGSIFRSHHSGKYMSQPGSGDFLCWHGRKKILDFLIISSRPYITISKLGEYFPYDFESYVLDHS